MGLLSPETYPVKISGTGSYVPSTVVSSVELAAKCNSSAEWIHNKLGIHERRVAAANETTSDLAAEAARRALSQAGIGADDLDLLIVATTTPDRLAPSTAAIVQQKLGGTRPYPAFDLAAACSGFLYGLVVGAQFVATGMYERILLVGSDTLSRVTDWNHRDCVYFGDGAGAAVLVRSRPRYGLLAIELATDGNGWDIFTVPAGGAEIPATKESVESGEHFYRHDGKRVFSFAMEAIAPTVRRVLGQAGLTISDIDAVIPHQAGMHALGGLAAQLEIPPSKITTIMKNFGNTAAASVPMALDECHRSGGLKKDDLVLFIGFGAGMSWGAAVLRWDA
jgi:3-oxoacyl-[acyl-carrier-protein] synthase-3